MASDAKVIFSSKVEYCAVIRYLYLKGKTGQEIHCELTNFYGASAPSYAQDKFWVWEFKRSRTSLEDKTRSGRPSDTTDEEMCNKVRDLVYSDRRIKVEEIAIAWVCTSSQPVGSQNPLAASKWQPEHQYTAHCWSSLAQRKMISFYVWWL